MLTGSKYPKNKLINFEKRNTGGYATDRRLPQHLRRPTGCSQLSALSASSGLKFKKTMFNQCIQLDTSIRQRADSVVLEGETKCTRRSAELTFLIAQGLIPPCYSDVIPTHHVTKTNYNRLRLRLPQTKTITDYCCLNDPNSNKTLTIYSLDT